MSDSVGYIPKCRIPLKVPFQWRIHYFLQCELQKRDILVKKASHLQAEDGANPRHMTNRVGMTSIYLLRPCLLDELSNASSHSAMLETWLKPQLRDRELTRRGNVYFAMSVKEVLNKHIPARWIGRGSSTSLAPFTRPPRSPDLTTSDNSLWGSIKDREILLRYTSNEDMHRAAEDACRTITPQMLRRTPQTTWRGVRLCVQRPLDV
jgi:hypothetical protein